MYHATETENAERILEQGLVAQRSHAITYGEQYKGAGVWLFSRIESAREFADSNYSEWVIFCVDVDGIELTADEEYDAGESYIATESIDADRLAIVEESE